MRRQELAGAYRKGVTAMNTEELVIALQETKDRSLRNEGRIKKLEGEQETLRELTTAVAVMAEQMKQMNNSVNSLEGKVDEIERRPARRWEAVVAAVITAAVGALIGFVLGQVGF